MNETYSTAEALKAGPAGSLGASKHQSGGQGKDPQDPGTSRSHQTGQTGSWIRQPRTQYEANRLIPKADATASQRQLLYTLWTLTYKGGTVTASVGRLAVDSGVGHRSVQRALAVFKEKGWIEYVHRSRGLEDPSGRVTSEFRVNWERFANDTRRAYEEELARHETRRKKKKARFDTRREPAQRNKGDKNEGSCRAPKGDKVAANLGFHLGKACFLENPNNSRTPEPATVALSQETGARSEPADSVTLTVCGEKAAVDLDWAARCAPWENFDVRHMLTSARDYISRKRLQIPTRTDLIVFLSEYIRKRVAGYEGRLLDQMMGPVAERLGGAPRAGGCAA